MAVFLILVGVVIVGTFIMKRQNSRPSRTEEQIYSPYAMEQPAPKKKSDLGGAFLFVIAIIAIIVFCVSALPHIIEGYNKNKDQGETKSGQTSVIDDGLSLGQRNAVNKAKQYLDLMGMSYKALVNQLIYEGFTESEAAYGASNCGADWNQQAARAAQNYLSIMSMSKSGLIEQLVYDGFTQEQAAYGAKAAGFT